MPGTEQVQLTIYLSEEVIANMPQGPIVTSDLLGEAFQPEQNFTEPNGNNLALTQDILKQARSDKHNQSGPFNNSLRAPTPLLCGR